jgi:hypothetical protein
VKLEAFAVSDLSNSDRSSRPSGPLRRGELPDPAIPYVHGRDLVPIRRQPRKYDNAIHRALFEEEDTVRRRINQLDQQVLDLSAERRQLLARIKHIHDELRPRSDGARGRRRRAVSHEELLPPAAEDAVRIVGRELRAICVILLRKAGRALTLRELHVLLHRLGYVVAHPHPAKALADALGHEADAGRAVRILRATYLAVGPPPDDDRSERDEPLPPNEPGKRGEPRGDAAHGNDPHDGHDTRDADALPDEAAIPDW